MVAKWLGLLGAFAVLHLAGMAIGGFCARRGLLGFGRDAEGLETDRAKQRERTEWPEPDAGTAKKKRGRTTTKAAQTGRTRGKK